MPITKKITNWICDNVIFVSIHKNHSVYVYFHVIPKITIGFSFEPSKPANNKVTWYCKRKVCFAGF